jgi:uncharacterized protein
MAANSTIIRTNSGALIDILNPDPALISIEDIAHSLSHICRFNGHTDGHYSVAQHCVLMSELPHLPKHLRLTALLHDAAEAYLGDVVRPLKHLLPEYMKIEEHMERVIANAFLLEYPFPTEIKDADQDMLNRELKLCFDHENPYFWTPVEARRLFLATYLNIINQQ